jgi:polysaccharide export outer membrane protein
VIFTFLFLAPLSPLLAEESFADWMLVIRGHLRDLRSDPEFTAASPTSQSQRLVQKLRQDGFPVLEGTFLDTSFSTTELAQQLLAKKLSHPNRFPRIASTLPRDPLPKPRQTTGATRIEHSSKEPRETNASSSSGNFPGWPPLPSTHRYLLGARDILTITIQEKSAAATSLAKDTREVSVDEAGYIGLPLVGRVLAQGKTATDLQVELTKLHRRYLKEPQISVVIRAFQSHRVFILGQVNASGPVFLDHEGTTILEVLAKALGFVNAFSTPLEGADRRNVKVFRGNRVFTLNLAEDLLANRADRKFLIYDGDEIYVPQPVNRIRVLGGVTRAGEFVLVPNMTLLDAVALAGSFTVRSRRDQIRILRRTRKGNKNLLIDATKIVRGVEEDIPLRPGDRIYVSEW